MREASGAVCSLAFFSFCGGMGLLLWRWKGIVGERTFRCPRSPPCPEGPSMKKLKLDLDALRVTSFEAAPAPEQPGTVQAHIATPDCPLTMEDTCWCTEQVSCWC